MSDVATVSSQVELVVLGCLAQKAPPTRDALGDAVRELTAEPPETAAGALEELRRRGLVDARDHLTDTGARALRTACGLTRRPTWSAFRRVHFATALLGIPPRAKGEPANAAVRRLAGRLGVASATSLTELCDALLAEQLGITGKLSLAKLRTHVLARRALARSTDASLPRRSASGTQPDLVAQPDPVPFLHPATSARPDVGVAHLDDSMIRAAVTRPEPAAIHLEGSTSRTATVNLRGPESARGEAALLASVRETLSQVGAEGRFGSEKVFVSALWQRLGPPPEMSLDHFKRWLVTANRNRWLTLARADVVGAMDPVQVRESEIRDLGATFHFVLDPAHNPAALQGRSHAR